MQYVEALLHRCPSDDVFETVFERCCSSSLSLRQVEHLASPQIPYSTSFATCRHEAAVYALFSYT